MSIKHLTGQSVLIEAATGTRTRQGKATYTSLGNFPARVQKVAKTIVNNEGEISPIHLEVFVDTSSSIDEEDRLTYASKKYRIMAVEEVVGYSGKRHHLEIKAQHWNLP